MKNIFLLSAVLLVFGFTSCKKDRTCTCETIIDGTTQSTNARVIAGKNKKDAEDDCATSSKQNANSSVNCTLD